MEYLVKYARSRRHYYKIAGKKAFFLMNVVKAVLTPIRPQFFKSNLDLCSDTIGTND